MQNFGGQTRCVMERCANPWELSIQPHPSPFPQNRVFKRRRSVLKCGGGRVGAEGFEAFEVSADLDLGRIHGHLFPCH